MNEPTTLQPVVGHRCLVHYKGRTRLAKVIRIIRDGSGDVLVQFHRTQSSGWFGDKVRISADMCAEIVFPSDEFPSFQAVQRDLFADVVGGAA